MRFALADDMWHMGQKYWGHGGFSIGTPVRGMCFNIGVNGSVNIPHYKKTPKIMVDIIKAVITEQVTLDDNVIINGNTTMKGNTTMEGNTTIVRSCNISNDLTVLGGSKVSSIMRIKTPLQGGGNLRIEPAVNGNESSVG